MKATCPECRVREKTDGSSSVFQPRGSYKGRPMFKCLSCLTTFYLPRFNGAPRRVDPRIAHEMAMQSYVDEFGKLGGSDDDR